MLAVTLLPQSISSKENLDAALPVPKIKASGVMFRHPKADPKSPKVDASVVAILEFPTPSGGIAQGYVFVATNCYVSMIE